MAGTFVLRQHKKEMTIRATRAPPPPAAPITMPMPPPSLELAEDDEPPLLALLTACVFGATAMEVTVTAAEAVLRKELASAGVEAAVWSVLAPALAADSVAYDTSSWIFTLEAVTLTATLFSLTLSFAAALDLNSVFQAAP